MSLNRYAKRRDENESELFTLARQIGALVIPLDKPLDALVGWRGGWYPTEVKRPEVEGHKHEFKPEQVIFMNNAKNCRLPVWVWRSADDVYRALGVRRTA